MFYVDGVNHIEKIPNYELISYLYEYILYHLTIVGAATVEQLLEVVNAERGQITKALRHCLVKGFVDTNSFTFNGIVMSYYSISERGLTYITEKMSLEEYDYKKANFKGQVKHFLEASELYFSTFTNSYDVKIARESFKMIEEYPVLRPDVDLLIHHDDNAFEEYFIEHDRSSEKVSAIMNKLNYSYGLYMSDGNPVNIVMTISKEKLMDHRKGMSITNDKDLKALSEFWRALQKTRMVMNKLELTKVSNLENLYRNRDSLNPHLTVDNRILENISYLNVFFNYNAELNLETSDDILEYYYLVESKKGTLYHERVNLMLEKYIKERVESIKNSIVESDDYVEINEETFRKYYSSLRGSVIHDSGKLLMPSIKSLLMRNEFIIGSLYNVKAYIKSRSQHLVNYHDYFKSLFDLNGTDLIMCPVEFYVGDTHIRKNINSATLIVNGKRKALVILEPLINLSDRLKLDAIKLNNVSHNYDEMLIKVVHDFIVIDQFTFI